MRGKAHSVRVGGRPRRGPALDRRRWADATGLVTGGCERLSRESAVRDCKNGFFFDKNIQ